MSHFTLRTEGGERLGDMGCGGKGRGAVGALKGAAGLGDCGCVGRRGKGVGFAAG